MPSYPHPPQPQASPRGKARIRAALLRAVAGAMRARAGEAPSPQQASTARILVIRPDHLGDLLFLGPAMRWLRTRLPAAHIALAIGPWARPALPGLAQTYDEIIELPFPAFERGQRAGPAARWRMLRQQAQQLRQGAFDAALIARPDHWWGAMLARFAGIPFRLGFETRETAPWLSHALAPRHEHAAAANLRLAAALTGDSLTPDPRAHPLRFQIDPETRAEAEALLAAQLPPDGPLAIIHPGSGAAVKLWDAAKWQEIARRLTAQGARVAVTGGPGEEAMTRTVADIGSPRVIDLGGRTSFTLLAALLAQADLVMGPDSGPLHLAVAVGTPTVHLYGPADPIIYGPWGDPQQHRVILSHWDCAPCGQLDWPDPAAHGCVRDIALERVWRAVEEWLRKQAPRAAARQHRQT